MPIDELASIPNPLFINGSKKNINFGPVSGILQ